MKDNKKISIFLDTATKALALAATKGEEFAKVSLGNPKTALERTHLGLDVLCDKLSFQWKDIDAFYCLLGPGSNTGIRLGLTIPKTLCAFNPDLELYGIKTMELFTKKCPVAALSDRGGNLFLAKRENGVTTYQRIDKKDIPSLPHFDQIALEKQDKVAFKALEGQNILPLSIIDCMMEYKDSFENFSSREEEFLPEYVLKI